MYSKDEAKQLMVDFWNGFNNYTKYFARKKGEPVEWMLYKTGIKGLELKFDLDKRGVRTVLESNSRDESRRLDIFIELEKYKVILEQGFDNGLNWTDDHHLDVGKPVMRISTQLENVTFHNRDNWPQLFEFMANTMWQLQQNFVEILPILEEKFKYPTL